MKEINKEKKRKKKKINKERKKERKEVGIDRGKPRPLQQFLKNYCNKREL